MDWAHKQAEEDLKELEDRIARAYARALAEAQTKLENFTASFYAKDEQKKIDLANGKITEEQYLNWRKGQFFIQGRWQALVDELARDLTETDKMAMELVADNMVNTYVNNYNYGLFDVDQKANISFNLTAYDKDKVLWLIKDNPDLLPLPDPEKMQQYDYIWNRNKINAELVQSILQGEDLYQLADRLENVVGMDRNSAIRNARTLTTTAENKGRLDSYLEFENKGIPMFKQWIATDDERTRASHHAIDHQVKRPWEPFDNGLMYPGDTSTHNGAEFYNCRCRLIANPYGISPSKPADANLKNVSGGRGFKQWLKEALHG